MLDKLFASTHADPSPLNTSFHSVGRSGSGVDVTPETALMFSPVFSAVRVISETLSLIPWRHYVRTKNGGKELQAGSTIDRILHNRPNSEQTAFTFREYLISCTLLWGNGYAEIERSIAGEPIGLWPIHPSTVAPKRDDNGVLFYRVHQRLGGYVDLPAADMLHTRGITKDGIVGYSIVALARESIGVGMAAEQFSGSFFGNGAAPSFLLTAGKESPRMESREAADSMIAELERRLRGPKKAGRMAYLEPGYELQAVGIPQKDAQFLETRKFSVTEIARWFRVPPHKIADLERATFSNIESQETSFVTSSILPWAVRFEQEADMKLLKKKRNFTKLVVTGLLRGDSQARAKYYTQMRNLGALDINGILALEDMNPIEGGDLRLVPLNMVSVDQAGKVEVKQGSPTKAPGATATTFRDAFVEIFDRFARKESNALGRRSQPIALTWIETFYGKQETQLVQALTPLVTAAVVALQIDTDAEKLALETAALYVTEAKTALAAQSDWRPSEGSVAWIVDFLLEALTDA